MSDRRQFIKLGVAAVGGAAVATAVAFPTLGNHSDLDAANSKVSSLQSQLDAVNSKVSGLQSQLTAANTQVSSLQGQLTTSGSQATALQAQIDAAKANAASLQTQLSSAQSQAAALQGQLTTANGALATANGQLTTANSNVNVLNQVASALLTLSQKEAAVVDAAAQTIIPTDATGPGAKEAGVLFFIDKMLHGDYGKNGNMYNKGPFVQRGQTGPITVGGITYPGGTMAGNMANGYGFHYAMTLRQFWRVSLEATDNYALANYGGSFASLTPDKRAQVLADLAGNKPTTASFNGVIPADFFFELFFMTWSGFQMDPMYGGNRGMVGWTHTAFNGLNTGNFYGEGLKTTDLMVASKPTRLKPASLQQFQAKLGITGQ